MIIKVASRARRPSIGMLPSNVKRSRTARWRMRLLCCGLLTNGVSDRDLLRHEDHPRAGLRQVGDPVRGRAPHREDHLRGGNHLSDVPSRHVEGHADDQHRDDGRLVSASEDGGPCRDAGRGRGLDPFRERPSGRGRVAANGADRTTGHREDDPDHRGSGGGSSSGDRDDRQSAKDRDRSHRVNRGSCDLWTSGTCDRDQDAIRLASCGRTDPHRDLRVRDRRSGETDLVIQNPCDALHSRRGCRRGGLPAEGQRSHAVTGLTQDGSSRRSHRDKTGLLREVHRTCPVRGHPNRRTTGEMAASGLCHRPASLQRACPLRSSAEQQAERPQRVSLPRRASPHRPQPDRPIRRPQWESPRGHPPGPPRQREPLLARSQPRPRTGTGSARTRFARVARLGNDAM